MKVTLQLSLEAIQVESMEEGGRQEKEERERVGLPLPRLGAQRSSSTLTDDIRRTHARPYIDGGKELDG